MVVVGVYVVLMVEMGGLGVAGVVAGVAWASCVMMGSGMVAGEEPGRGSWEVRSVAWEGSGAVLSVSGVGMKSCGRLQSSGDRSGGVGSGKGVSMSGGSVCCGWMCWKRSNMIWMLVMVLFQTQSMGVGIWVVQ